MCLFFVCQKYVHIHLTICLKSDLNKLHIHSGYICTPGTITHSELITVWSSLAYNIYLVPGIYIYIYTSRSSALVKSMVDVIIISLAIRQCAAWSSTTLITHNFPERRKPWKQNETQAPSLPLPSVPTSGLSTPFAVLTLSFSVRSILKSSAASKLHPHTTSVWICRPPPPCSFFFPGGP